MRIEKSVALILILAFAAVSSPVEADRDKHSKPAAEKNETAIEPIPFRFEIDEISLMSRDKVIVHDSFDRDGKLQPPEINGTPPNKGGYYVSFGRIEGANVRGGALTIDQTQTINAYGDFVAMVSLPMDNRGKLTFAAVDTFGDLVYTVRVRAPKLKGPERFKIGIGSMESYLGGLASMSLQKDSITIQRQGRRAWDEVILDKLDTSKFPNPEWVEMIFKVDAEGKIAGQARIKNEGQVFEFKLSPTGGDRIIPEQQANLAANIFIETLPKPRIFAVHPQNITAEKLREAKGVIPITVYGVGFTSDAQIEILPDDGAAQEPVKASGARLVFPNSILNAKVAFKNFEPKDYTVRITTGGETISRKSVLRVF
jgi:hypothetical protein